MRNLETEAGRDSVDCLVRSYIQIEASVYEIQEAKRKLAERIAEHMRQERKARGISQAEFARRMECTPGLLCYMENGERTYCGKWALAASNVLAEFDSANITIRGDAESRAPQPKTETAGGASFPASPVRQIPRFFAGRLYVEEDVQGGTGDTPDEALQDYLDNHADDEVDYVEEDESGTFTVEIYAVHEPTCEDGKWDWELGRCVEKRDIQWRREPDPEWPGLERIIYLPNVRDHRHLPAGAASAGKEEK
jgi:transcriptional regulator with XRE-family HTH domain